MPKRPVKKHRRGPYGVRYRRSPDVVERRIDDTAFLVRTTDDTIYYLNPLSTGIWHLLADPASREEAVRTVREAFPDTLPAQVATDVANLFQVMEKRRLILRVE